MLKIISISLSIVLFSSFANADWLDDLAQMVDEKQETQMQTNQEFDISKALLVVDKYVKEDEKEVARLEKKLEANDEDGVWATIRGGTYQVQWANAKANLNYHQKVYKVIKELPDNKNDRQKFFNHLKALQKNRQELAQLKSDFSKADGWGQKAKVGALVAAKEVQIKARKGLIKSGFLV